MRRDNFTEEKTCHSFVSRRTRCACRARTGDEEDAINNGARARVARWWSAPPRVAPPVDIPDSLGHASQAPKSHPMSTGQQCPSHASILLTNVNHVFGDASSGYYHGDHHGRALFGPRSLTERNLTAPHPSRFPCVIRYSPSSYVNAGHSLRSRLNDWTLCGNPHTTKPYHRLGCTRTRRKITFAWFSDRNRTRAIGSPKADTPELRSNSSRQLRSPVNDGGRHFRWDEIFISFARCQTNFTMSCTELLNELYSLSLSLRSLFWYLYAELD